MIALVDSGRPVVKVGRVLSLVIFVFVGAINAAHAQSPKRNILVICGNDIGVHIVSAYNHGIMGYQTPNIDRIAKEGAMFTHYYAQQSRTAGRASVNESMEQRRKRRPDRCRGPAA